MTTIFKTVTENPGSIAMSVATIIVISLLFYRWMNPHLKFYKISEKQLDKKITTSKISDLESITAVNGDLVITKNGQVYLWNSPTEHELILNLKISDPDFTDDGYELGLMGVCRINNRIYLCYTAISMRTSMKNVNDYILTINEYSQNMEFIRTIDSIDLPTDVHHAGTLQNMDNFLIVSTGDGGPQGDPKNNAQRLDTKLGKILMYDISSKNSSKPKVLVYGLRNPWKFWISPDKIIYIGNVGYNTSESIYKIDLKPVLENFKPVNCGWRNYEGSYRRGNPLKNIESPFFEYPNGGKTGKCVIAGFLVDQFYLLADYFTGTVRLLNSSGEQILETRTDLEIFSLGMMKNDSGIFGPVICARDGVYWMSIVDV